MALCTKQNKKSEKHNMWKPQLLALLSLAGCDGLNTFSSSPTPSSAAAPLTLSSAAGTTYVPAGPSMVAGNGFDTVTDRSAKIQIVSSTQINVNDVPLYADADGVTFRSLDGTYVMKVNSATGDYTTDQALYMLAAEASGGQNLLSTYVMGNTTAAADIPKSGTASYSGSMTLFNEAGAPLATLAGPALVVSLDTAKVNGHFTYADTTVSLAETTLVNGSFLTTMKSGEASPLVTGTIDGSMFGAGGKEISGTVGLQYNPDGTPTESYVGYYGVTTP